MVNLMAVEEGNGDAFDGAFNGDVADGCLALELERHIERVRQNSHKEH